MTPATNHDTVRLGLGLSVLLASGTVLAQTAPLDPYQTMLDGEAAYERGDFQQAASLLSTAFQTYALPIVAHDAGVAHERLGRWVEAAWFYQRAAECSTTAHDADPAKQREAQQQAAARLAALEPQIPHLTLTVQSAAPAAVTVLLDGTPAPPDWLGKPQMLDPGDYHITTQCHQKPAGTLVSVTLAPHNRLVLPLQVPCSDAVAPAPGIPSQPAPPAHQPASGYSLAPMPRAAALPEDETSPSPESVRIAGWSALGVGAAGTAVWAITGLLATSKKSALENDGTCTNAGQCNGTHQDDIDQYNSLRRASTVGFWVGVPLLAAGASALIWQYARDEGATGAHADAWVGVGSAGVRGSF